VPPTGSDTAVGVIAPRRSRRRSRLSEGEKRFERNRRTVGLFLGPIVLIAMLAIPFDLEPEQHRLAAILAFVVVWWVTANVVGLV
jgi:solute carrier family 13 (sodium-dependent dicarboxylate transporter), member 2/3/5